MPVAARWKSELTARICWPLVIDVFPDAATARPMRRCGKRWSPAGIPNRGAMAPSADDGRAGRLSDRRWRRRVAFRDIHDRKHIELTLKQSEARLRELNEDWNGWLPNESRVGIEPGAVAGFLRQLAGLAHLAALHADGRFIYVEVNPTASSPMASHGMRWSGAA